MSRSVDDVEEFIPDCVVDERAWYALRFELVGLGGQRVSRRVVLERLHDLLPGLLIVRDSSGVLPRSQDGEFQWTLGHDHPPCRW